ncbi:NAD(P)-binding protein [Aaosphaeria arxii CBS 175.79]|uniref:L-gulonate 3-dehydrogenase n=1 Tax=Aaosphaeria arxii CBS 175.79 TaxID=1450172 RepID=A0A6A5XHJ1_9PLEO|nr:NAD(P)-binding protein [Aaosphaeria arxii CBS 175.79]KAF2012327.1 NAD(P)-binding protein [Aaosphaeria arxii CBS 175.79]
MDSNHDLKITLIGTGTIGLSFAVFHLTHLKSPSQLTIYDTRPDLEKYIQDTLLSFYSSSSPPIPAISEINIAQSLKSAVEGAHIIQESGPENLPFKTALWKEVEQHATKDALLWSSTSGIPASQQSREMQDTSRLLVVHPYNPPNIMPLLELVPSPDTRAELIERTQEFWRARGRVPVHIKKEVTGFVANRLAFALLREAIHLVDAGVVTVAEVDDIVQNSMGPRWAVAGPFKSYHAGGGAGGLEGFFKNIGGTVQGCWDDAGRANVGEEWEQRIFREAEQSYGSVDTTERDMITRRVLEAVKLEKQTSKDD